MNTTNYSKPSEGRVAAVCRSDHHSMQKNVVGQIELLEGLGVKGDAHAGVTVKHRSRVAKDPTQPNLRQVHLIHQELHEDLATKGFTVNSGQMGENITTSGIDLLNLPKGTQLHLGDSAIVTITGLRNPCYQLDGIQKGLMAAVIHKDESGVLHRKAGIMGIVTKGGVIDTGDTIEVVLPPLPHQALEKV